MRDLAEVEQRAGISDGGKRFREIREPRNPTKKAPSPFKVTGTIFAQAPKALFRQVTYNCPNTHFLFDIKGQGEFSPQPLARIVDLTTRVRDQAAEKLKHSTWCKDDPKREALIEAVFIGRKAQEADKATRLRIIPLPSIGFEHADRAIRRILAEVPPNCPIPAGDIAWAFSGAPVFNSDGVISGELVQAQDWQMARHYGIGRDKEFTVWRTVTAAALPVARRRIDPTRKFSEAKNGEERQEEELLAAGAVGQALRHSGVMATAKTIRLQREPWDARGARVEAFAEPPRFLKERLWHVEVTFAQPVAGPLTIGDGRYLGLGLMAPVQAATASDGVAVFRIDPRHPIPATERENILRAVRRAVMALAQEVVGSKADLPRLFSGHEPDGRPARSGRHEHLFFAAEATNECISRVLIVAPWRVDRSHQQTRKENKLFDDVTGRLGIVRAGKLGVIELKQEDAAGIEAGPLFKSARMWKSATPYLLTRHTKSNANLAKHLTIDIANACHRLGLPSPKVTLASREGDREIRLEFSTRVRGPIMLGQGSHFGSGLFIAV